MNTKKWSMKMLLGIALTMALVLLGAIGVLADSSAPIALMNGQPATGMLAGNPGGSFDNYQIAYPGSQANLQVTVTYSPADSVVAAAFGFNVYDSGGLVGQSTSTDTPGVESFTYSQQNADSLSVQVYNYLDPSTNDPTVVSYSIVATGVAQPQAVPAVPVPVANSSANAPQPIAFNAAVTGTVLGEHGGGFSFLSAGYSGDNSNVTVNMTFWPDDPSYSPAIGFNVYDPTGSLAATGQANSTPELRTATFASSVAGNYLIEVYNYVDGLTISYNLTAVR